MNQPTVLSRATRKKLDKLADILEQASTWAREISQAKTTTFTPVTPKLRRPEHAPKDE